ncbi:MAG: phosphate ABC transporter permease PstA [Actinobacteria bacterium]|nr:phosphate ABC transporter permease PstA [Actinomycetota bacterium]
MGALAAGFATTALLWAELSPFSGIWGYFLVSWGLSLFYFVLLLSFDHNRAAVRDRLAWAVMWSLALLVLALLVFIVGYTFYTGWPALHRLNFYTQDMHSTQPTDPLSKGGALHAIIGTLIELVIAMAIAVPLGLLAAVFLNEVPGKLNRLVRLVVDAMTALPDVLAGLFIYATLILIFGLGQSGLAAACALAVTAISIVCRAAYVVLRLVPGGLTEASYALGSGHWRTVWRVTLPTARSGLATAVSLGAARAIGETAPVLLTSGYTNFINLDPVHNPMTSLPLMAYTMVNTPEKPAIYRGFAAASVLLVVFFLLVLLVRMVGGRAAGHVSRGQLRRRLAASRRDLSRITRQSATPRSAVDAAAGYSPADTPSRRRP